MASQTASTAAQEAGMRMLPSSGACATRPATDHRAARSIVTRLAGQTHVGPPMLTPRTNPRKKERVESAMSCCCRRSAHWSCRRPMQAWVVSVAMLPPAPPPRRPPHLSLLISLSKILSRSRSPRLSTSLSRSFSCELQGRTYRSRTFAVKNVFSECLRLW